MYYSGKNLYNSKVNFVEILRKALSGRKLIRAVAYTIKADVKDEKNFHEALEKIGFEVRTKDLLVFHGGHKKGDWDVGIAMDAVRAAEKVDVIVVVSGDGDFKEMYEYVRGKGCRIEVMAFGKTASSSIKDYVDLFIDMDKEKKFLIPLNARNVSRTTQKQHNSSSAKPAASKPHAPRQHNPRPAAKPHAPRQHSPRPAAKPPVPKAAPVSDDESMSILEINAQQPVAKPAAKPVKSAPAKKPEAQKDKKPTAKKK